MSRSALSSPRPRRTRFVPAALILILLVATLVRAIQTPEVEIGNGGAYDGMVKIRRDDQGRMILTDSQVTAPVSLNDLRYAGRDHGLLLGLDDDDHAQYHTTARHEAAHTANFNGGLATPADVNGNPTLGTHLADAAIHPNRSLAEQIVGGWIFSGLPLFQAGLNLTGGALKVNGTDTISATRAAALTQADIDNMRLDGNTLSSLNAGGDILLAPNGSGKVGIGLAGSPAALLHVGGDAMLGTSGGGNRALTIQSATASCSTALATINGDSFISANNTHLTIASNNSGKWLTLGSGPGDAGRIIFRTGGTFAFQDLDSGNTDRLTIDSLTGNINLLGGDFQTAGVSRLKADGSAVLTRADVDNLQLDGNTLASINTNGDINLAPNGTGQVAVAGNLSIGSGGAKITLNGQRLAFGPNLLDNPDFNIWQRNISQLCASGGNAAGTITWPVPGTLTTGADRWQVSRARTDMASTLTRALPPAPLPTAQYCLKNEYNAGNECQQYIHQTLPRELTATLRGRWVTFAVSHYLNGAGGGNIAIYKFAGTTPTALVNAAFTATANTWERLAVSALVPEDTECLCVCVKSNLAAAGPTVAYLANAAFVEGRHVSALEKVSDPTASSLPPLTRHPAEDLERCQRYFEKGHFSFSNYSAGGGETINYSTSIHYNTAKAASPTISLANLNTGPLASVVASCNDAPAFVTGASYPQGFFVSISGSTTDPSQIIITADWTASCPEPN